MDDKNKCIVLLDGEETSSSDFVAVLSKPDGDATILYNTDALTLGMAMKLVAKSFIRCMNDLEPAQRDEIEAILGTANVLNMEGGDADEKD